jgi:tRNA A37 threonylcarbamoyltransferase TsaD
MIAVAGMYRLRAHEQTTGGIEVRARWPLEQLRPPGAG